MPLPPLQFDPILKPRAWGGTGLQTLGKAIPVNGSSPIGESWEVSDLPPPVQDGISRVRGGPYSGAALDDLMRLHRKALLGRVAPSRDGRFPLLVKFLDAGQNLSVQVHPTEAFAKQHPDAHSKSEVWVVLEAQPGAVVFRGVHPEISAQEFERCIRAGAITEALIRVPVSPGDCVPLKSGMCHALGAGVTVAEVQTPSDTTFRIFDWNRNDPARPLNIGEAMQCVLLGSAQELESAAVSNLSQSPALWSDGLRADCLCSTDCFEIEAIEASPAGDAGPFQLVTNDAPVVGMLLRGEAQMETQRHPPAYLRAGDTVLFPAQLVPTSVALSPDALFVRATLPPPLHGYRDSRPAKERLA